MIHRTLSVTAFHQIYNSHAHPQLCSGTSTGSTKATTTKSPTVHISVPSTRSNFNIALPALRNARVDPITSGVVALAAILGWIFGRLTSPLRKESQLEMNQSFEDKASLANDQKENDIPQGISQFVKSSGGENAIWLNMSLRTLWRLFRKSTNSLTRDVLQPVLDDLELPDLVKSVTITNLTLGESPALVRDIDRLPSRSLSEIQYRFGLRLVGDINGKIDMDVAVKLPGFSTCIVVPVSVSRLDIDAKIWIGFTVVPYKPWVRFVQWALVKMPVMKLKLSIANILPISAVPVLSTVMNRILTKDIPKEFLFPKTKVIDLMGKEETDVAMEQGLLEAKGVNVNLKGLSDDNIKESFPKLSSLFETMDTNNDGMLNVDEVVQGLIEWGYASKADQTSIYSLLDIDNDGIVKFREFINVWGDLQNVFVPRRFRGVVSGVLLEAEGLRSPFFGFSNPYVVFSIEQQEAKCKKNKETSATGSGKGCAVWNESWELFVQFPKTAILRIEVFEGCAFAYYSEYIEPLPKLSKHSGTGGLSDIERANGGLDRVIGYGMISLAKLKGQAQTVWVELQTGGGRVKIDVQFSEFVDPKFL